MLANLADEALAQAQQDEGAENGQHVRPDLVSHAGSGGFQLAENGVNGSGDGDGGVGGASGHQSERRNSVLDCFLEVFHGDFPI